MFFLRTKINNKKKINNDATRSILTKIKIVCTDNKRVVTQLTQVEGNRMSYFNNPLGQILLSINYFYCLSLV